MSHTDLSIYYAVAIEAVRKKFEADMKSYQHCIDSKDSVTAFHRRYWEERYSVLRKSMIEIEKTLTDAMLKARES